MKSRAYDQAGDKKLRSTASREKKNQTRTPLGSRAAGARCHDADCLITSPVTLNMESSRRTGMCTDTDRVVTGRTSFSSFVALASDLTCIAGRSKSGGVKRIPRVSRAKRVSMARLRLSQRNESFTQQAASISAPVSVSDCNLQPQDTSQYTVGWVCNREGALHKAAADCWP